MPAPLETDKIREAAIKEMAWRGWDLQPEEKKELEDHDMVRLCMQQLNQAKNEYDMKNIRTKQTPLGKVARELIELIAHKRQDSDPES
jgi:hypothetical protein